MKKKNPGPCGNCGRRVQYRQRTDCVSPTDPEQKVHRFDLCRRCQREMREW